MSEDFTYRGWPVKPPVIMKSRTWPFVCAICGKPGEGLSPSTSTHPGACRKARVKRDQARANARRKKAHDAAKNGVGGGRGKFW